MTEPTDAQLDAILAEAGITITAKGIDMPAESLDRLARLVWIARRAACSGYARFKPRIVPTLNLDAGEPLT